MSTATVEPSWAAFAAIDWGDCSHAWSLLETATGKTQTGQFPHTEAAVEAWASSLLLRFHGQPIAVGLEQSRGALLYLLLKYPHLTIFPIAPAVAARYRRTFAPSGAKSD